MDVAIEEAERCAQARPAATRGPTTCSGSSTAMLGENAARPRRTSGRALQLAPQRLGDPAELRLVPVPDRPRARVDPRVRGGGAQPALPIADIALINAGKCSAAIGEVARAETYFRRALRRRPATRSPPTTSRCCSLQGGALRRRARADADRDAGDQSPARGAVPRHVHRAQARATRRPSSPTCSQLRNRWPGFRGDQGDRRRKLRVSRRATKARSRAGRRRAARRDPRWRRRRRRPDAMRRRAAGTRPLRRPRACPRAACRSTPSRSS